MRRISWIERNLTGGGGGEEKESTAGACTNRGYITDCRNGAQHERHSLPSSNQQPQEGGEGGTQPGRRDLDLKDPREKRVIPYEGWTEKRRRRGVVGVCLVPKSDKGQGYRVVV